MRRMHARPSRGYLVAAAALVVTASIAGWAFTVILSPAPGVPHAADDTLVTAIRGEVGSHLTLNTAAQWQLEPVGTNEAAGVVTTVDTQPGDLVAAGARLYSVNLRPVVVAEGAVPAYRPLGAGDRGADVAQLQKMLTSLGFYSGAVDGVAGDSTATGIKRWQNANGVDATGEVSLGDVIFVPSLPAKVVLKTDIVHRGATLGGGEPVLQGLGTHPDFTLPVSEAQSAMIPSGTRVLIDDGRGDVWQAQAAGRTESDTGTVVIALHPESGASICGVQCDAVAVVGQTLFASRVVTVETVAGIVVPVAALRTDAAGSISLESEDGALCAVTVVAESQGMAVVTGIDAGLVVRVPLGGSDARGTQPLVQATASPATASP